MTASFTKKLSGWYSYAFASEVFVIVSLTLFLPICLEQFARDNGRLLPDRTEPCNQPTTIEPSGRCVVQIGWLWSDTASFSLYVYSISVLLQAIGVISVGGIADHPPHRKRLFMTFALLGSTAAMLFLVLPSTSSVWFLSAPLAICANVGFGVSVVAMNSYLPSLARESPDVADLLAQLNEHPDTSDLALSDNPEEPLIARPRVEENSALRLKYDNELSKVTSKISSTGIAVGYGAGIFLLILTLIPVTRLHGSTFSLRLAIGLSGLWWALFSIPAAIWLPGAGDTASLEAEDAVWVDRADALRGKWSFRREVGAAWKRLGAMLHPREIAKLRNTFKYLAAWFLLSDGFATITSTAVLFAKTSLNMSPNGLIVIGIITPASGILGSLVWPRIQRRFGWSNLKVLVILVILASLIPFYGCLGFLFQGKLRFGGLTTQGEMFGLAVYFGSVYGAFQGYARAFYAELLPQGEEARWYGLFSITDKSSSFLGPLIVGVIADMTGNIRYAFFFLVVMVWLAVPVLMSVDVEQGRKDAREYRVSPSLRTTV
ncbi:autophagy-related protein 22-like protein [Mycena floridula]|nr:autophagy-related protein 22-like protein [Mycena floridula]